MIEAILYFLFVIFGLGFAVWKLLKLEEKDDLTKIFIYAAIGLATFIQLSLVLGALHSSNWMIYLGITIIALAYVYTKHKIEFRLPAINKNWIIVLILFLAHFAVYLQGAFIYPWLEDDDPWEHAAAVRYVAETGTYLQPNHLPIHYLAPYPPFFDMLLGTLFQVDGTSLQFILKFFNVFLISLSIPFFYVWAREKLGERTALWAAFILTALPCFMSHFIWAQTLAMVLVFPSLYLIDKYRQDKKKETGIMAVLTVAGVLLVQPSVAAMFGGMVVLYALAQLISHYFTSHKFDFEIAKETVVVFGVVLMLIILEYWAPMFILYPTDVILRQLSLSQGLLLTDKTADTSGGLVYGINDYLVAPKSSKMDQPVGFGEGVFILLLVGVIALILSIKNEKNNEMAFMALVWVIYGFIGTEGNLLPVKLFPHRFWVFLAVAVAIVAGIGAVGILSYLEKKSKGIALVAMITIFAVVALYSADSKIAVETSMWPPGVSWVAQEQLAGYVNLNKVLPHNTKVFSFCGSENAANGFDLYGYISVKEISDYKTIAIADSVDVNYQFLKKYKYEYTLIDAGCISTNTKEKIEKKLNELNANVGFTYEKGMSNNAFMVFKIN